MPSERFAHRMAAMEHLDRLLLFGGCSSDSWFNDLHWFHADTMTWEKVADVVGDVPVERVGCTFVAMGSKVILFGGRAQVPRVVRTQACRRADFALTKVSATTCVT
jgi:hypothetical protein